MAKGSIKYSTKESLTLLSGWPITCQITYGNKSHIVELTMKKDMEYFNITDKELAFDSGIHHKRIYNIKENIGSPADYNEISILSLAFNRIVDKRMKLDGNIRDFEENFLCDNQ